MGRRTKTKSDVISVEPVSLHDRARIFLSSEQTWRKALRLARHLLEAVLMLAASVYVSKKLQELSGSALWLPSEWRLTVQLISSVLGTSIFFLVHLHRKIVHHRIVEAKSTTKGPRRIGAAKDDDILNWQVERKNYAQAIVYSFLLMFFVTFYILLRGHCVVSWDSRDWITNEQAADIPATSQPNIREKTLSSTPVEPVPHLANYPDFVNLSRGEVYVPIMFPVEQRDYFQRIQTAYHQDGITWVLTNEPDRLFDWLRGSCRDYLQATTCCFLGLHLLCIGCFACALAYAYAPLEAAISFRESGSH